MIPPAAIRAVHRRVAGRLCCKDDAPPSCEAEHRASGVIFLLLKFCDPHSFDYPYMKEMLDAVGVPSMLMEIEQDLPSEGQLSTRFEAFIEMLR